ncbi:MAG: hypothetical protein ACFB6S_04860 [Geminicoccaceae bacterium]
MNLEPLTCPRVAAIYGVDTLNYGASGGESQTYSHRVRLEPVRAVCAEERSEVVVTTDLLVTIEPGSGQVGDTVEVTYFAAAVDAEGGVLDKSTFTSSVPVGPGAGSREQLVHRISRTGAEGTPTIQILLGLEPDQAALRTLRSLRPPES